ncbi:unnamed protein product [Orchesella dallaii]|uniref:Uncharacterized protein n=1 Tax=Orchesella dallaii TaxID=48710 RepID=A0ABP1RHY7_9HEXA
MKVDKNPYYDHLGSLPPQILPPYRHIPQQQNIPQLQSLLPQQQSTKQHHRQSQVIRDVQHQKTSSETLKILQIKEINYKSQLNSYKSRCRELEMELKKRSNEALIAPIPISSVKFNNLVKMNKDLVAGNEKLRQQNEELKCEEKVNHLKCKVDRLSNENRRLTTDGNDFSEQVRSKRTNYSALEEEYKDFRLKTLEERNELKKNLENNTEAVKMLEKELLCSQNSQKAELEALQNNSIEVESKIHSFKSTLESCNSRNDKLVSENRGFLNTINELKDEKLNVEGTVESLQSKVRNLTKKLSTTDSTKQNHDKIVEGLQSNNEDFNKQFEVYEARHANPNPEEDKLKDEINNALLSARFDNKQGAKTAANLEGETKNLAEKLKSVENKNKKLVEEVDNLKGEKVNLSKELQKIHENNEKLSEQIATLKSGNKKFSTQIKVQKQQAKQKVKQKQRLITKHENEVSYLNEKLDETENQIQTSSESIKKLQTELEEQKKTFSSKIKNLKEKLENKRERERKKLAYDNSYEIERLTRDLKEERARCVIKSDTIASLKNILSGLEVESKRIKPLMNQVETLKLDKNHLSEQLDARLQELKKQQSTIESLKLEVKELQKSNKKLDHQVIANLAFLKKQEDQIKNQNLVITLQKAAFESSQQKEYKLEKESEEKAKYFKELDEKLNDERKRADFYASKLTNSDKANAELQTELNTEKSEKEKAEVRVQQEEEKIDELSRKIKNLREDTDHFHESFRKKKLEMRKANEKIDKLKDKISHLKEKAMEAEQQQEKSQTSIVELTSQPDRMKSELEQAKLKPFTITSKNIMKHVSNTFKEDSEDEFPVIPSEIFPTREKKKQKPNDDVAGESFQPSNKRVRWHIDLNNLDVTQKIDGYKDVRFSGNPLIQVDL